MKKLFLLTLTTLAVQAQFLLDPYRFGSGGVTPPLDGTNAWAAFSFSRKLRTAYSGSAFRAYDGTNQQDIGFSGNLVDTNALVTFAGGGTHTIYVNLVYDQVGNNRDLTALPASLTDYPRVMTNGSPVLDSNGYLCASLPTTGSFARGTALHATGVGTVIYVFSAVSNVDFRALSSWGGSGKLSLRQSTGPAIQIDSGLQVVGGGYTVGVQTLAIGVFNNPGNDSVIVNNGAATTGNAGNALQAGITLGGEGNNAIQFASELFMAEFAWGNPTLSDLQDNINAFYTIW